MTEPIDGPRDDPALNPALKSRVDETYDTRRRTPAPLETTAAREGQGEGWPIIWVVVTLVCIGLAIYFLV